MRTFLLVLFLFSIQLGFTQDYTKVDSIVKSYPKTFESIKSFANKIDTDFETDLEKTRAAYFWISNNIFYDFKTANSNRIKDVIYTSDEELLQLQYTYAENVLNEKKGICEGYSQLLKYTLNELNIQCEVIEGYAKTDIREIGWIAKETNHAWNAVFLNNKWQLIDATWSTGNDENEPNSFKFNDVYFLIKPKQLIWSHFPKAKKWQLLDKPISKSAFFYSPIIHHGYYNSGLILSKMTGLFKSQKMIQISFETINEEHQYYYQYGDYSSNLEPLEFSKKKTTFMSLRFHMTTKKEKNY